MKNNKKNFGNVTLDEILDRYTGRIAKVGTGSSFLYCDTVNDKTRSVFDSYSSSIIEAKENELKELTRKLNNFPKEWKTIEAKHRTILEARCRQEVPSKAQALRASFGPRMEKLRDETKNKWEKKRDRLKADIGNYTPILNRHVVDVYRSLTEPDIKNPTGVIIIIEGNESGQYWSSDEYRNSYVDQEDLDGNSYVDQENLDDMRIALI